MNERLVNIIKDLQEIVKDMDLAVDENIIFEQACSFLRGELASEKRPFTSQNKIEKEEPATIKQLNYLKSLGIKFKDNLTKKEAYQLIKEKKWKQ